MAQALRRVLDDRQRPGDMNADVPFHRLAMAAPGWSLKYRVAFFLGPPARALRRNEPGGTPPPPRPALTATS
ncbi:MAG: hypothetical protein JSR92_04460 [Proteobacteria bacterium]|nr:hypothetical protein [Pseudomonadota bacterium]